MNGYVRNQETGAQCKPPGKPCEITNPTTLNSETPILNSESSIQFRSGAVLGVETCRPLSTGACRLLEKIGLPAGNWSDTAGYDSMM